MSSFEFNEQSSFETTLDKCLYVKFPPELDILNCVYIDIDSHSCAVLTQHDEQHRSMILELLNKGVDRLDLSDEEVIPLSDIPNAWIVGALARYIASDAQRIANGGQ